MRPAAPGTSDWPAEPAVGAVGRQLPRLQLLVALLTRIAGSADVISFWGWAACSEGQEGDGGKAGERFKIIYSCQLPRLFWIRAKQYAPGRSPAGCATRISNARTPTIRTRQIATGSTAHFLPGLGCLLDGIPVLTMASGRNAPAPPTCRHLRCWRPERLPNQRRSRGSNWVTGGPAGDGGRLLRAALQPWPRRLGG